MKKIVKTLLIAFSMIFSSLLTACGTGGNNEPAEITSYESGEAAKDENQSDTSETTPDITTTTTAETSAVENEDEIKLDVHHYKEVIGGEKGGLCPFDYNGTEYAFPIIDCMETYIIDKDNNIFVPLNETMEFNPESRIDAAMADSENFEYLGRIRETSLGNFTLDEAYVYRYGKDLILIHNNDNSVRYNPENCERLYNIEFTDEERYDLPREKIDFEETLLKYGVEYDPSIYFVAILYSPYPYDD